MTAADSELARSLKRFVTAGATVALGDGVGAPGVLADGTSVGQAVTAAAHAAGGVRLVLGWMPVPVDGIDAGAFAEVIALMPGWGVRTLMSHEHGRFVPTPLSAIQAVLAGPLRPDVLVTRLTRRNGELHFTSEVSWQQALVSAGTPVIAVLDETAPSAHAGDPVPADSVHIAGVSTSGPQVVPPSPPGELHDAIADRVCTLIPPGARLQYGPGQVGTALLNRIEAPIRLDTGLLTDAVVDLDERGLLDGTPSATYLLGTARLYEWAHGKPILRGIEYTHDPTRLSTGQPFVAVNTAVEIDPWGQVNVEGVGARVFGGIGGHPDFCATAAANSGGLSIIAVPTHRGSGADRKSTLVAQLSRPVSTPAYDIDVIVTETGHTDLRGADWDRRRDLITKLFHDTE